MIRSLVGLSILVPSLALAQPGAPEPPPPPPSPPREAPPPPPEQPPAPAPAPVYYAPAPAPRYQPPPPPPTEQLRRGVTFEANIGLGFLWFTLGNDSSDTEVSLAGLNLGVGGWLSSKAALTLRVAGVTYVEDGGQLSAGFFGPSLQYWLGEQGWIGGGIGLAFAALDVDGRGSSSETGVAFDLRAGYTLSRNTESTWNISLELTPGYYDNDVGIHGFGILFGYQHL